MTEPFGRERRKTAAAMAVNGFSMGDFFWRCGSSKVWKVKVQRPNWYVKPNQPIRLQECFALIIFR
jgi:hypothetical protein